MIQFMFSTTDLPDVQIGPITPYLGMFFATKMGIALANTNIPKTIIEGLIDEIVYSYELGDTLDKTNQSYEARATYLRHHRPKPQPRPNRPTLPPMGDFYEDITPITQLPATVSSPLNPTAELYLK